MNMYGNSEPELTNQQKAAILFIVLGPEYSSMLFKHMNDEEIEKGVDFLVKNGFVVSKNGEIIHLEVWGIRIKIKVKLQKNITR